MPLNPSSSNNRTACRGPPFPISWGFVFPWAGWRDVPPPPAPPPVKKK